MLNSIFYLLLDALRSSTSRKSTNQKEKRKEEEDDDDGKTSQSEGGKGGSKKGICPEEVEKEQLKDKQSEKHDDSNANKAYKYDNYNEEKRKTEESTEGERETRS